MRGGLSNSFTCLRYRGTAQPCEVCLDDDPCFSDPCREDESLRRLDNLEQRANYWVRRPEIRSNRAVACRRSGHNDAHIHHLRLAACGSIGDMYSYPMSLCVVPAQEVPEHVEPDAPRRSYGVHGLHSMHISSSQPLR